MRAPVTRVMLSAYSSPRESKGTTLMAMEDERSIQREVLAIPDLPRPGLVTYDAKDPDTSFAPIES